ncbi:hypothetical protein EV207_11864 [Scopulibacillus darangshiensis]|uniref:Uncharacterized protein n=2 Tax=Scopulibacillus darangshiensis TaxID=442528 RepID=A0A4V2SMF5_9BACL|nr:hypothetical protein EV207_11864 [Scopulibacillus darangshiensis]
MSALHNFSPKQYGSVNSTIGFVREFGMTVGITIFGTIQSHDFANKLKDAFAGMGGVPQGLSENPRAMLSQEARAHIPGPILSKLTDALSTSITEVFY